MINRDYAKAQIDTLPDGVLEKVLEFISFQKYSLGLHDNDTDYLTSIPGMSDKIRAGLNTPLVDCASLSEVWPDV
ncbi:MAG: hypothetical protein LBK56_05850 [Gracilibacteraceae bacterium]|jgi:hypothetical protein|nr:hypothetical protein [Gracilibacteraceae bacterium]